MGEGIFTMEKTMKFVTHNGKFHADEAMGTAILNLCFWDTNKGFIRTDNPAQYVDDHSAIIYDIGGGCFDHHMKGGNGARENGVPYSSAGLLWKEYGRRAVYTILDTLIVPVTDEEKSDLANKVVKAVDEFLIQGIDAVDNGKIPSTAVQATVSNDSKFGTLPFVNLTTISDIISDFNQKWCFRELDQDMLFMDAVNICTGVLINSISKSVSVILAQKTVNDAVDNRKYRRVVVLDKYMPWISTLLNNPAALDVWYCIFPSARRKGSWQMQAIPVSAFSREQRHPVPTEWWGAEVEDLRNMTWVPDAEFCHPSGFLSGAGSLEGMLRMAQLAVSANGEELEPYNPDSSPKDEEV